jgi:hypothetical protein
MSSFEPIIAYDKEKRLETRQGIGMALHCHHYLGGFQKMIDLVDYVDGGSIMYNSGETIIRKQLTSYFESHPEITSTKDKIAVAVDAFSKFGLGKLDFSGSEENGGTVIVPTSHVAKVMKTKVGKTDKAGHYLTAGLISGIMSAVYDKPLGTYTTTETSVFPGGSDSVSFKVEV